MVKMEGESEMLKRMIERVTFPSLIKKQSKKKSILVMGAVFQKQEMKQKGEKEENDGKRERDVDHYFQPSCLPSLNNRLTDFHFFQPYYEKSYKEIILPPSLMDSPKNTILHYFSVLREAENLTSHQIGGCGTVGNARLPFPIAYNFFTKEYQRKVSYKSYLQSFQGIGHTRLIKLHELPVQKPSQTIPYFIELETIEGSSKNLTYFAYHYGYVYLQKENNTYKIADLTLTGEDFLCAAYHLWQHNAEAVVDIEYGNWCGLVKKRFPTKKDGYVKTIDIIGTDGYEYRFVFFQLTNDTDILVTQYKKGVKGKWEVIRMDPTKCLNN